MRLIAQPSPSKKDSPRCPRREIWIVMACAVGLTLNFWMFWQYDNRGVDFNQFYSASKMTGTGHLYNWEELRRLELQNGNEVPTGRLPVVLFGVRSISWLPYRWAFGVWGAASVGAFVGFALLWPGVPRRLIAVVLAWSTGAAFLLVLGQDTPFFLLWVALGVSLLVREKPKSAGVVFALCICKFHLAVAIPIFLAAQKRWSTLIASAITGAGLLAACFAIEGSTWPMRYLKAARDPLFSPAPERMPNLWGMAFWLPSGSLVAEVGAAILVVALIWIICRKCEDPGVGGAVALAGGLILAPHGYLNDCAVLIPLLVLTIGRSGSPRWLKFWAILAMTPLASILIVTPRPYLGQFLIVGFVIASLSMMARSSLPFSSLPTVEQVVG